MNDYKLAIQVADENQLREICAALMAERDAFAVRLEDAEEQYSELHNKNSALAAQVEVLQKDKSDLLAYVNDAEKWFNRHDPNGYFSPKRETAQQHLAEIRAKAGRAGYIAGFIDADNFAMRPSRGFYSINEIKEKAGFEANQYAERIRRGEVE